MAFAMGHHPRIGAGSQVLALEAGVVHMILDRVWWTGFRVQCSRFRV